jgi:hypothetical protein
MSFSDPTVVNIGSTITPTSGTATNFPRVDTSVPYQTKYQTADALNSLRITHQLGTTRTNSVIRLDLNGTYTDPTTGLAKLVTTGSYLTVNRPLAGFTTTQIKDQIKGLMMLLATSTNLDRILGLES